MAKRIPKTTAPEQIRKKHKAESLARFCEVYIPQAPSVYTYGIPEDLGGKAEIQRGSVVWVQFSTRKKPALAVVSIGLFGRRFISGQITWFVFDTISISLFMMIGLHKAILHSYQPWCAVVLGVVTAVAGGILRDICINEVPLIFRKELYALACAAGGILYFLLPLVGVESIYVRNIAGLALIFVIRALAIKYHLGVPVLTGHGTAFHHSHKKHGPEKERRY